MSGTIQKWGNSLAVRIPRSLANELGIKPGTHVQISRQNGQIIIIPAAPTYALEDLVKGITAKNRHRETDTGAPRGKEIW